MNRSTCGWPTKHQILIDYHDTEWGVPVHDDRLLFEFLVLDWFQAGLSWLTMLNKRENFRKAFDNFNIKTVASYHKKKTAQLLQNSGIIRNRQKIEATIRNAGKILEIIEKHGSLDAYIWQFTEGKMKINQWHTLKEIPATSPESDAMSRDLKSLGFGFSGSTMCYAFMQSVGMVNDHLVQCFRYKECMKTG
ncbi:MAG: DNA-3-methyladenine glycosylase I [Bacteroidales bacterium]|nr:DNA-3-methyladenine glycosylase I [Bacteroidales bacterium]